MLVKIAVLFLAVMLALALFGGFWRKRGAEVEVTCRTCGKPLVGRRACDCRKG
jgi:hypothetical protein